MRNATPKTAVVHRGTGRAERVRTTDQASTAAMTTTVDHAVAIAGTVMSGSWKRSRAEASRNVVLPARGTAMYSSATRPVTTAKAMGAFQLRTETRRCSTTSSGTGVGLSTAVLM